jgi:hypothetical protein
MINLSEDRILDFLDGRLASPDEAELLHTLSVSPERRQVMREHIKLREVTNNIARQDRFAVPGYVTDDLFVKLEALGYSAPVSTEALLSRTPEYVSVAATAAVATAVSTGWRIGALSILTASIMSFILGAGAYYVFGSSLGLRTRSQELADAKRHSVTKHMASLPIAASPFDVAAAEPVSNNASKVISNSTKNTTGSQANVSAVPVEAGFIGPVISDGQLASSSTNNADASASNDIPISYTAPVRSSYSASAIAPQPLTDVMPFWPSTIPAPLEKENGTIGLQYAGGPSPDASSSSVQWNQLYELKFGFTLLNYFAGSASMGFLSSFERSAQGSVQQNVKDGGVNYANAYVISASGTNVKTSTLLGFEGGVTLDHIGIPVAAMGGLMFSGDGTMYKRASLMMRFEPFQDMVVSAGIEGLFYTHDMTSSLTNMERAAYPTNPYHTILPTSTTETAGLVGPSIQLGWHF